MNVASRLAAKLVPKTKDPRPAGATGGGPLAGIEQPRAIIDRRALSAALARLVGEAESLERIRPDVLQVLKAARDRGRAEIRRRFEAGARGPVIARAQCHLVDQLVRLLYDHASRHLYPTANLSTGERLSLVALGGYGRVEMAPFSDVDLLFLLPYKETPRTEQIVETVLYLLWDLGFKVGQAVRTVEDCIRLAASDHVICTSLLEARWVWGDQELYRELKARYRREIQGGGRRRAAAFIEAKLNERDERHRKHGASRYSLEPNIKEGKGGLRDLQSLFWLAKFLYNVDTFARLVEKGVFTRAEVRRFEKAHSHLWTLRCDLHYQAGRAEERLTFDLQMAIAPQMGYTAHAGTDAVERFMKHYFLVAKDVGTLTRIFCSMLESDFKRQSRFRLGALKLPRRVAGFALDGSRLGVKEAQHFRDKPIEMLRIFRVAQDKGLDIQPETLRWITQSLRWIDKSLRADPKANALFLDILTAESGPETALRRMNEAGVFGRFLPDFGRVVAQMQYNMYHHFTVDEHTLFAIGILHAIEQGHLAEEAPIASEVVHQVISRRVLYVAVLLHDIAKGRPGDHSEVGAKVARQVCPRLGLSEAETATVAWLVLHHLAMSDTAFKRDLDDPKTIQDFAERVQSPERLRLLLVLTVADIRAVGPGVWTSWKAVLLRELYSRTDEVLSGRRATGRRDERVKRVKEELREALEDWSKRAFDQHLRRGHPAYWLSADLDTLARQARLVQAAEKDKRDLTVETRVDSYRQATEVTVYTADHAGLFSRLAGAMAVAGATIDAARIATLKNGMALDSFFVEDQTGGPFDSPAKRARLVTAIEQTLSGRLKPLQALSEQRSSLASRYRVFRVPPVVLIDNKASGDHTLLEINARDRPGLLYHITLALTKLNLMIKAAHIATYGERAVDVFYVQDPLGDKIENKRRLKTIETRLLAALEAGEEQSAPAKPGAKVKKASAKPPSAAAE